MKQIVLVVEDDHMIRKLICSYLEKDNYTVVEAEDGEEAQDAFLNTHPCLVILDLMLPKLSGEAFCKWAKDIDPDVSIMMLSAKVRVDDRIYGLKIGADHYMTKPFNPDELMANVEAILRRTGQHCQKIAYDGISILPRKGQVLLNGEEIQLTKHEFQLLYLLMQQPNIVFSREQLVNELYPHDEKTILDRTIDAHIKKLREKIEKVPSSPERIQTVRGMGYKFVSSS